jgi:hypothetical protein
MSHFSTGLYCQACPPPSSQCQRPASQVVNGECQYYNAPDGSQCTNAGFAGACSSGTCTQSQTSCPSQTCKVLSQASTPTNCQYTNAPRGSRCFTGAGDTGSCDSYGVCVQVSCSPTPCNTVSVSTEGTCVYTPSSGTCDAYLNAAFVAGTCIQGTCEANCFEIQCQQLKAGSAAGNCNYQPANTGGFCSNPMGQGTCDAGSCVIPCPLRTCLSGTRDASGSCVYSNARAGATCSAYDYTTKANTDGWCNADGFCQTSCPKRACQVGSLSDAGCTYTNEADGAMCVAQSSSSSSSGSPG